MPKPIPDGYHTLTPNFVFKNSLEAIAFYKKAFGATERGVMTSPDGKSVMHAEIQIGTSRVMLGDMGPNPVSFYVYVNDVDAAFKQAVAAGATVIMPVQDMFWGDRVGAITDPFGYSWSLASHTRDVTPEQLAKGAAQMAANMAGKSCPATPPKG